MLTHVTSISQGTLSLLAEGPQSRIDFSSLLGIGNFTNRLASITERGGGTVQAPQWMAANGVQLTLQRGRDYLYVATAVVHQRGDHRPAWPPTLAS